MSPPSIDLERLPDLRGQARAATFRRLIALVERDASVVLGDARPTETADLADLYCRTLCDAVRRSLPHDDTEAAA